MSDDDELRARVLAAAPIGTDSADARAQMTANGFDCVGRRGEEVDTLERDLDAPPPARITCIMDESAQPETSDGFRRHFVDLLLDGHAVARVEARTRIERLP